MNRYRFVFAVAYFIGRAVKP